MQTSFVDYPPNCEFPLQNIPFGVFSDRAGSGPARIGTALGEHVVDLSAVHEAGFLTGPHLSGRSHCFTNGSLNEFMSYGRLAWREARETLIRLLSSEEGAFRDKQSLQDRCLIPKENVVLHLPANIGDYTDFYASREHATNVGTMFRGREHALQPNWVHLPVGYHGRSSSIVVSGTDVKRPVGQQPPTDDIPGFGPSKVVDFELEMGAFIGPGNELGTPISVENASDHVFGLVLLNDWSARDIQKWEYVPLGPFNGKNWATTISPWVVTLDALEPFKCSAPKQIPAVLPYLQDPNHGTYDVNLRVDLQPAGKQSSAVVSSSNLNKSYWTFPQMVAHHTVGGCNLRPGDLLGSGTISTEEDSGLGSLLEASWNGSRTVELEVAGHKIKRTFLENDDTVILRGWCQGKNYRVGFGECKGKLIQGS